jgi:hypothetical protein
VAGSKGKRGEKRGDKNARGRPDHLNSEIHKTMSHPALQLAALLEGNVFRQMENGS